MFEMSTSALTRAFILNRQRSIAWSVTVCWVLDKLSIRRHSISSISHTADRPAHFRGEARSMCPNIFIWSSIR